MGRDEVDRIFGTTVYDTSGDEIGPVGQVYADDETGEPQWVTVFTGLFGTRESFVPLSNASLSEDRLTVPFSKAFVKGAPNVDVDGHLSPQEEGELYAYYHATDDDRSSGEDREDEVSRRDQDAVPERSGPAELSRPDTEDAMTMSEERLRVGTERRATDRVRLRKVVVTENVTMTVPVQREEVRIERDPIGDADDVDDRGGVDGSQTTGTDDSTARGNEGDHR